MLEDMQLEDPASWQVQQVLVFDWYDGPRSGFCWLIDPSIEFLFQLLDERPTEDDLDDRIYSLSELPRGTCRVLMTHLAPLGEPSGKVWCPIWQHPDPRVLKELDDEIDAIIKNATPTGLVVHSRDMILFRGCWRVPDAPQEGDSWFDYLGL